MNEWVNEWNQERWGNERIREMEARGTEGYLNEFISVSEWVCGGEEEREWVNEGEKDRKTNEKYDSKRIKNEWSKKWMNE